MANAVVRACSGGLEAKPAVGFWGKTSGQAKVKTENRWLKTQIAYR